MDNGNTPKITPELLQQNPALAIAMTAFVVLFSVMAVGALSSWVMLIVNLVQGKSVLPVEPWKPRSWGLIDLIMTVVLVVVCQIGFTLAFARLTGFRREDLEADAIPLDLAAAAGLGNLAAMFAAILWLVFRHRVGVAHAGFSSQRLGKNLLLGMVSALIVLPLLYIVMAVVSLSFKQDYDHPLLQAMLEQGSLNAFLLACLSAVIIAPITEEFLFRVLIQGWLQSIPSRSFRQILFGAPEVATHDSELIDAEVVAYASPVSVIAIEQNPFLPQINIVGSSVGAIGSNAIGSETLGKPPIWPAILTGTLFGLAHFEYGLSFIPLIGLGIFLGFLYRATHSIWPSLVVHFTLNSMSMLALGVNMMMEQAAK